MESEVFHVNIFLYIAAVGNLWLASQMWLL